MYRDNNKVRMSNGDKLLLPIEKFKIYAFRKRDKQNGSHCTQQYIQCGVINAFSIRNNNFCFVLFGFVFKDAPMVKCATHSNHHRQQVLSLIRIGKHTF